MAKKQGVQTLDDVEALFSELMERSRNHRTQWFDAFGTFPSAVALRELPMNLRSLAAKRATELFSVSAKDASRKPAFTYWTDYRDAEWVALSAVVAALISGIATHTSNDLDHLCKWCAKKAAWTWTTHEVDESLLRAVERYVKGGSAATQSMTAWLKVARDRWNSLHKPEYSKLKRVARLLEDVRTIALARGEAWSDAAIHDIETAPADLRATWMDLIDAAGGATSASPSAKWLKSSLALRDRVGATAFAEALSRWFPLVDKPRTVERVRRNQYDPDYTHRILDPHMDVLKGLCWLAASIPDAGLARALGKLALSAYRKIPGLGPRAIKVGNAAVYALGNMPGMDSLGQLAMLRVKVKFGGAQKMIEKALNAAAVREGLPRDEIEELGVPSYGLTDVGVRLEELGDFTAELRITGIGSTEITFHKKSADAKPAKAQKSVPAAVKTEFADELKELKAAAKDIGAMLPAQRDRIDSLYVENKTWPYGVWRERYFDHALVGVLARRLIWLFGSPGDPVQSWCSGTTLDDSGTIVDVTGAPLKLHPAKTSVRLWHPIEEPGGTDAVLAWRRFFEDRQIRQPFKQAHREVYLLTDAERNTGTYSNRYAAHVIRQHQFNALCGVRGWKNKLRLMVDAEYPPASKALAAWNLRAEYWIEGAGDEHGSDTNESGVYNLLTTDQVRFYPIDARQATAHAGGGGYGPGWGAEALAAGAPLDQIPALVFSEIMRDVDLFVGVCSVANNPAWQDGGPNGQYQNYWWGQSFGDLSATGAGRHDFLSRLLPRLKIAPVCTLAEKFLVVKGKIRTYKIHLGSGNILMEPDDQYLCIVPSSRDERPDAVADNTVFLPFEGDRTLAIILSKAFMLAADDQIKDSSIVSQIKRGK